MVGETWQVSPHDCRTSLGLMQKNEKQKAFLYREKQNPPSEGSLLVCLDFADVVIDGMTTKSKDKLEVAYFFQPAEDCAS
jgi:hypothetical protein